MSWHKWSVFVVVVHRLAVVVVGIAFVVALSFGKERG